ncbi:alpha-galactosidase A [Seiridium cupressi]
MLLNARAVGYWNPATSEARGIISRGFDWPTLKMKDISDDVKGGKTEVVDVKESKGKDVLKADSVFVNTKDEAEHQLDVYKDIKGKGISMDVLAVIVDDDDDDKVVGFAQTAFDGEDAKEGDLDACKSVLQKLHNAGWLHMDPLRRNYKKVNGNWIVFDFEDAKKTSDNSAYTDVDADDDEDREEADFAKQKSDFESPFGLRKD